MADLGVPDSGADPHELDAVHRHELDGRGLVTTLGTYWKTQRHTPPDGIAVGTVRSEQREE